MTINAIKNETDYSAALARIEALIEENPQPGSPEADELDALTTLVEAYESKVFPTEPPDPVDAILFRMEQQDLSQRDLVPFIGSRSKVSEVLARKRPLTLPMIRALHFGLGIPAASLIREPILDPSNGHTVEWGRFPLNIMARRGWIKNRKPTSQGDAEEAVRNFLAPLGSLSGLLAAYRKSDHIRSARSMDDYALLAWTAEIVIKAVNLSEIADYESGSVTLDFMRSLAQLSVFDNGPALARDFLAKHGIALCIEPHLPHTYLDGAAVLFRLDRPVIGLTIRYDRIDSFWFTLMHELAHLALHFEGEVSFFYDDLDVESKKDFREQEADEMAGEVLIPSIAWLKSPASKLPSPQAVHHLAKQLRIHPAIVAGKIRHESKRYRLLPNLVGSGEVRRYFPEINWSV
jgi:HTH-type transcriptional regulator/antitoxin HigA